jgi:WD40 repeat protein
MCLSKSDFVSNGASALTGVLCALLMNTTHLCGQEILRREISDGILESLAVSADGSHFAVAVFKPRSSVAVTEVKSGRITQSIVRDNGRNSAIAFDKNGTRLAFALLGGKDEKDLFFGVRIWELNSDKKARDLKPNENLVAAVLFSPDGTQIASADSGGEIRTWDVASGRLLHSLPKKHVDAPKLAFSSNGKILFSAGKDGQLNAWDLSNNSLLHAIQDGGGSYVALAACPNGKTLLAARASGKLETWDLETQRLTSSRTFSKQVPPLSFAFSESCELIATGSSDATIKLWNRGNGEVLATLKHSALFDVQQLAFTSDARVLLSGGNGPLPTARAEVIVWDLSALLKKK